MSWPQAAHAAAPRRRKPMRTVPEAPHGRRSARGRPRSGRLSAATPRRGLPRRQGRTPQSPRVTPGLRAVLWLLSGLRWASTLPVAALQFPAGAVAARRAVAALQFPAGAGAAVAAVAARRACPEIPQCTRFEPQPRGGGGPSLCNFLCDITAQQI